MANPMRIRAVSKDGSTEVRVLMSHPMATGQIKDAAGVVIPAHYITDVTAQHNGKIVLSAQWGTAVSKDPYLFFKFKGGSKGDKVTLTWTDNKADKRTDSAEIT
jgi:sulfur-oxidizing protein SoxZ